MAEISPSIDDALPQRPLRDPEAQPICLDLLTAKQEAVDRGVPFPVPDEFLSDRCQSFFHTLDLTRQSCRRIGETEIPPSILERVQRRVLAGSQPHPAPI